jgi:hypothetical protein
MTTLVKPDGSYTSNLNETLQAMLDHLIATDDQTEDKEYHKRTRLQTNEPNQTSDGREFTPAEVKNAIADLKDGITGVIYQTVYKLFFTLTYSLYRECLRTGCLPKRWKKAKIIPITKPGKRKSKRLFKIETNKPNKCGE